MSQLNFKTHGAVCHFEMFWSKHEHVVRRFTLTFGQHVEFSIWLHCITRLNGAKNRNHLAFFCSHPQICETNETSCSQYKLAWLVPWFEANISKTGLAMLPAVLGSLLIGTPLGFLFLAIAALGKLLPGHPMYNVLVSTFDKAIGPFFGLPATLLRLIIGLAELSAGLVFLVVPWGLYMVVIPPGLEAASEASRILVS